MANSVWRLRIRQSPNALFQSLSGEGVFLNLTTEQYFGLDRVGTRVWELVCASGSAENAVHQMLREYDVSEPQLRSDVERILAELQTAGLIEFAGDVGDNGHA
jgi:hypothetical protein